MVNLYGENTASSTVAKLRTDKREGFQPTLTRRIRVKALKW